MMQTSSGGIVLDESVPSLFSEVAKIVRDEIDLLEVSSRCRVNPTTLRKILEARPISHYAEKKIRAGLGFAPSPGEGVSNRPSTVTRLRELHRLYREKGTLAAVGRETGLSRERVRQLLVRGAKIGLFEYAPLFPSLPSKEKILDDYRTWLKLDAVAEANRLSMTALRRLQRLYRITPEELAAVRNDRRRRECIDRYLVLAEGIGHHPTTTELQRLKEGRSLQWQIRKRWGSFDAFRRELKIPSP
ncbi:hypothetical protein [Candidatus Manganitrophus noduliformans]|uniref:Uncharacterized protein n=1 Tax=Candidatus Manganitrophus noduliformans TaxID=2606439 RepID=A0A7X6IAD6_9BACT|nr:hypothetical protein [Candidatus Manganitrophus noduliformans]NKE70418.1 hypothetical protein [Candidatus Manganitrophus noduliformans]